MMISFNPETYKLVEFDYWMGCLEVNVVRVYSFENAET